jgi:hypothetical protein
MMLFIATACEYDADGKNFHHIEKLPDETQIAIILGNSYWLDGVTRMEEYYSPGDIINYYESSTLFFEIFTEFGSVQNTNIFLDGDARTSIWRVSSGHFSFFTPSHPWQPRLEEGKLHDLRIDIYIEVEDNNNFATSLIGYAYLGSVAYKVQYIKTTEY